MMSKTRLITLMITVFALLLPVCGWADTSANCEQENIFDSGDTCLWPYGQTGTRCCCWCPDPTGAHAWGHVMDFGTTVNGGNVSFEIRPGAGDANCITTGYMYYSADGSNWMLFWSRDNLSGWTTYADMVNISDDFRYIRANTDGCPVDWSKAEISGPPDLTSGLAAYWSFDNCDATDDSDDSGNGHNGTLYGNPQCVDGEKGKAFSFDGVDDYIETQPLGINTGESFTVSFWMNFEWQDHRIWTLYFGNPNNCGNNGFHSLINVDNIWGLERGVVQYGPHCGDQNQFNIANLQGQWIHVVTVHNSNEKTLKSYINADIIDLDEFVEFSMTNNGLYIGQVAPYMEPWNANSFYKGIVDEVRIYNRALTEAEIQALYGGEEAHGNLEVSPSSHDFGELFTDVSSLPQPFELRNTGDGVLQVSGISLSDTTNFILDFNGGDKPCATNRPTIESGQYCTIAVMFNPSTGGPIEAQLKVSSDNRQVNIGLSGKGLARKVQLDVTAINQRDENYIWHAAYKKFLRLKLPAGCVPASLAMVIDYAARIYANSDGIDFALVIEEIRERFNAHYHWNFWDYIGRNLMTWVDVKGDFFDKIGGSNAFDIGNGQSANITWNPYYNQANSYDDMLHRIKLSIDNGNPVTIVVPALNKAKVIPSDNLWSVKGKLTDDDLGTSHMMVIVGYKAGPECTDNNSNICSFIINDTFADHPNVWNIRRITWSNEQWLVFPTEVQGSYLIAIPRNTNSENSVKSAVLIILKQILITAIP